MSGGTPGNVGGGRPPAEIRDHARRVFDTAMSFLEKMASGEATRTVFETFECTGCGKKNDLELKHYPQDKDVLKAIEMAGKYGIRADGYDKQFVERLFMVVHHHVQDLVGGIDALTAIEEVWNRILAEYEQT